MVVIGILSVLLITSYINFNKKATIASLQSDLTNNTNLLKTYYSQYSSYPTLLSGNCPQQPSVDSAYCLKTSSSNTISSYDGTATTFNLKITNGTTIYQVTESTSPMLATLSCPSGYIIVPGSATYGTSDFCVMKYEAKADNGSGVGDTSQASAYNTWPADSFPISVSRKLVSTAAGYPIGRITQTAAITAASNYALGCTSGCHLITEAEWMTIAQNVLSVPGNWTGGAVGNGTIYSGHTDNSPAVVLGADASDANGYAGTGNFAGDSSASNGMLGNSQRRTLTLTNGEVIWDLSGNSSEWTSGTIAGGQPSGMPTQNFWQWTTVSGGTFVTNPYPSGTGISGSASWDDTKGIGRIYGWTGDNALYGFLRSGRWNRGYDAGVLSLDFSLSPSSFYWDGGFRVVKS